MLKSILFKTSYDVWGIIMISGRNNWFCILAIKRNYSKYLKNLSETRLNKLPMVEV